MKRLDMAIHRWNYFVQNEEICHKVELYENDPSIQLEWPGYRHIPRPNTGTDGNLMPLATVTYQEPGIVVNVTPEQAAMQAQIMKWMDYDVVYREIQYRKAAVTEARHKARLCMESFDLGPAAVVLPNHERVLTAYHA